MKERKGMEREMVWELTEYNCRIGPGGRTVNFERDIGGIEIVKDDQILKWHRQGSGINHRDDLKTSD
jgi:hypothetical protein